MMDDRTIAAVARRLDRRPAANVGRIQRLGQHVYRVERADQTVVVKLFPPRRARAARRELLGLNLAQTELAQWTPRLRETGALPGLGHTYLVYDEIAGVTLRSRLDSGQIDLATAMRLLGGILATFHRVRRPGFGPVLHPDAGSAAEFVGQLVADRARRLAAHGYPRLGDLLAQLAKQDRPRLLGRRQAVLCHGDLHPDNVLVEESAAGWEVRGVIDYGSATFGFSEYDLAKTLVVSSAFEEHHRHALLDGYRPSPVDPVLLRSLTTFHAVDGWLWAALIERRDEELWRQRLAAALMSGIV